MSQTGIKLRHDNLFQSGHPENIKPFFLLSIASIVAAYSFFHPTCYSIVCSPLRVQFKQQGLDPM